MTAANPNPFTQATQRLLGDNQLAVFLVTIPLLAVLTWIVAVNFPVLIVGILLAYLMDGIVAYLVRLKMNVTAAISAVIVITILFLLLTILYGLPLLGAQVGNLMQTLANAVPSLQQWVDSSLDQLPDWISHTITAQDILANILTSLSNFATAQLGSTVSSVGNVFTLLIYVVLMPLLVFFLLRDKNILFAWLNRYIPHSQIFTHLYVNLQEQFGAYVRGKVIEGLIIFAVSFAGFAILGLNYTLLLAVAIGASVIIPFVGAVAVTFPVLIVAGLQFGLSADFWYVLVFYLIVQALDGQLLVPLLFSEIVRIHPIALLVSLVVFGSIWGIWGVFFAIPLSSLIKCFILAIEARLSNNPAT